MMNIPENLKVPASGAATVLIVICVYFETAFLSSTTLILHSGLMCPLIFIHNLLSALLIAIGTYFCASFIARRERREDYVPGHVSMFSAIFAVVAVLEDVVRSVGLDFLRADVLFLWIPVAAIEACGIYFAMLMGLRRQINAWNLLKVCAIFLVGAVLETAEILCLLC